MDFLKNSTTNSTYHLQSALIEVSLLKEVRGETLPSRQPTGSKGPASCPVTGHHGDGYMLVTYPSCTLGAPRKPAKVLSQWPKGHSCPHHLSHQTFDNCTLLCVYKILSKSTFLFEIDKVPCEVITVRTFISILQIRNLRLSKVKSRAQDS